MKDKLVENMVVTVEPGIYLPGFGGVRIEDDVIVKSDRAEVI
jgi:Xaa-Pro aminopeptidase